MATLKPHKLNGAILTERGTKIIPRGIRFFMKRLAKIIYWKQGVKYAEAWGNHAETLYIVDGVAYVIGAIKEGFKMRKFTEAYSKNDYKKLRCFVPKIPYTAEELARGYMKAKELEDVPYQFWNFPAWVIYIGSRFHIDLFRREQNAEKKIYCFEGVARLANAKRPGLFDDYEEITSIYDIESNPHLENIEDFLSYLRLYLQ